MSMSQDIIDVIRGKKKLTVIPKMSKKITHSNRTNDLAKINELIKSGKKIKLNLGCGFDYKEGWQNIDNNYYDTDLKLDFEWDLSKPLLFPDNSVDYIFSEHFFEHLTYEDGLRLLKDCHRCLKQGGVIRTALPDLQANIDLYNNPNWRESLEEVISDSVNPNWTQAEVDGFKKAYLNFKTKAEVINIAFREHDGSHKWLYDYEEFTRLLTDAGFKTFKRYNSEESKDDNLKNIESRKLGSTLVIEASK